MDVEQHSIIATDNATAAIVAIVGGWWWWWMAHSLGFELELGMLFRGLLHQSYSSITITAYQFGMIAPRSRINNAALIVQVDGTREDGVIQRGGCCSFPFVVFGRVIVLVGDIVVVVAMVGRIKVRLDDPSCCECLIHSVRPHR